MLLFGGRQIISRVHWRVGYLELPRSDVGNPLQQVAFTLLAGASETPHLESQILGGLAKRSYGGFLTLPVGRLNESINDRLG